MQRDAERASDISAARRFREADVGRVFREESGRSIATLVRHFGDIDLAEDAVQEAFATALRTWPRDGLPSNPGGWITTTARNRAIDRVRREARGRDLLGDVAQLGVRDVGGEVDRAVNDDRLSLIFTCCHPALSTKAQVALTLRLLGGLTTAEVARAFLVTEPTMAQRLARAKRKIAAARLPYRVPEEHELPDRLRPVLAVVYLVYNAGADAPETEHPAGDLRVEGLRLARLLVSLMPDEPEVAGLLALLLLTEARWPARFAPDGSVILLRHQDRRMWDGAMLREGQRIVRSCLRRNAPGPYQIQAAVGAVHADADVYEGTDWAQIVRLYDQLMTVAPSPVAALNRAVAVGEVAGADTALLLVDGLELHGYHPAHAARADLLRRVGRLDEARIEYARAAATAPSAAVRDFLTGQARHLG